MAAGSLSNSKILERKMDILNTEFPLFKGSKYNFNLRKSKVLFIVKRKKICLGKTLVLDIVYKKTAEGLTNPWPQHLII